MNKIILGQECICPDGLGRVAEIVDEVCGPPSIRVDTYINNRGCVWAFHNVELIDPRGNKCAS